MTTLQEHITISQPIKFLVYRKNASDQLCLFADEMTQKTEGPVDELLDYMWETMPIAPIPQVGETREEHIKFGIMQLSNQIAIDTRRALANIVVVQNQDVACAISDLNMHEVFIDDRMDPDEVRLMYWKLHSDNGVQLAVDGGLAITPDGIYFNNTGEHLTGQIISTSYMKRGTFK